MSMHRSRFFAMGLALASPLLAAEAAHAQLDIHVSAGEQFVMPQPTIDIPLLRFLSEGIMVTAETRSSPDVVLYAAYMSRGKLVAQGTSAPFRLDAKTASSSPGMLLGAGLSSDQLLRMAPVAQLRETTATNQATAETSLRVAELLEDPGAAIGLPGMNPGIIGELEHVLLIAVIPARSSGYARSTSRPMVMALQGALH
jgi:hypothetical protein